MKHWDIHYYICYAFTAHPEKLLCLNMAPKDEGGKVYTLPPPIITHTEATPLATPQGSPNEHSDRETMARLVDMNSLTIDSTTVR